MLKLSFNDGSADKEIGEFDTPEAAKSAMISHAAQHKYGYEIGCIDIEDGHLDAAILIGGTSLRLYKTEEA